MTPTLKGNMDIKVITSVPKMCECGRLYKDRRDKEGKMMCSACYTGLSIEDLKKLWGSPVPDSIKNIFKSGTPPTGTVTELKENT